MPREPAREDDRSQGPQDSASAADEGIPRRLLGSAVFIHTGDAACAIDDAGRIVDWSAAAEKLFGFRPDEAIGRPCGQIVRCHDLRSQLLNATCCPVVESLRRGRSPPASHILVHDRHGRSFAVAESVYLHAIGAERRALLQFVPIPSGVVDPTPWASRPLAGAPESDRDRPPDLAALLDRLLATTGADAAELFLAAPVGRQLVLAAHQGRAVRAFRQITSFEPGSGFPGLVAQTGAPLLSVDLPHDDRYLRTEVKRRGFRSYLCVPVASEAGFFGSLHIASLHRDYDPAFPLPLLAGVARGLATALEVTRFRTAQPIVGYLPEPGGDAAGDVWHIAELLLRTLMETSAAAGGALLLPGGESGALEPLAERGWRSRRQSPRGACDPAVCPALQRRAPVFQCAAISTGTASRGALPRHLATTLCLPLIAGGKPLGVAALGWEGADPLPTRHLTFLHGAIASGAVALHNALVAWRREQAVRRQVLLPSAADTSPNRTPAVAGADVRGDAFADGASERPLLSFHCLGRFKILRDGREVSAKAFGRRQPLVLLKILLAHYGRSLSWDRIAELFWPEETPPNARVLVELVVHRVRRALEPEAPAGQPSRFIRRSGESYFFDPRSPHRLDSREFSEAAALGARLEADGRLGEARDAYRVAGALYAGDFLEDEPYGGWTVAERERLREQFLAVVRRLVHLSRDAGDTESTIAWSRRGLAVDETREELHHALMEGLWRAGRKDQALRQYRTCRTVLERELDVAPSAETTALFRRIADG